jgi:hypothetical protein
MTRKVFTQTDDGAMELVSNLDPANMPVGLSVVAGVTALDGTNPTPIVTGLTTVVGFALTIAESGAPGLGTSVVTGVIANGTINVTAWKPTGAGDTTLIASTGTEDVSWVAVGIL